MPKFLAIINANVNKLMSTFLCSCHFHLNFLYQFFFILSWRKVGNLRESHRWSLIANNHSRKLLHLMNCMHGMVNICVQPLSVKYHENLYVNASVAHTILLLFVCANNQPPVPLGWSMVRLLVCSNASWSRMRIICNFLSIQFGDRYTQQIDLYYLMLSM